MKAVQWISIVPAALLLATAPGAAGAREEVKDHQVFDTSSHPRLSLKNINGQLTVEGWDKNRIELDIVKSASSTERLQDLDVEVSMTGDHLRIVGDYEDNDRDHDYRGEATRVDFTLRVPRGTVIDAVELVNGNADVRGIDGDVQVSSVNGRVSGEMLGGDVELATVNGEVELVAADGVDSIRMHSVNGGVSLVVPKQFNARIKASTVHGSIRAMDGLDVDSKGWVGSSMQGTLGKGGLRVDLNTVNGSIEIREGSESGAREKE